MATFACFRIVGVRMVKVEELYDMEAAFVDVEVDITCFKVGGCRGHKQKIQVVAMCFIIYSQHKSADDLSVLISSSLARNPSPS